MQDINQGFYLFILVLLILGLVFNISPNLPRFPWDINLDKGGLKIYIPLISAVAVTIMLAIILNLL